MKAGGIVVGVVGATLFAWHLAKILAGTDAGTGFTTHHIMSLVGGLMMFVGTWLYVGARKRRK